MTDKYKAGDIVHVVLTDDDSKWLNAGVDHRLSIDQRRFIAHISSPEPVVRWLNIYNGQMYEHKSLESAKCSKEVGGLRYLFTARLEFPDGDTSKDPIVTVEDV